jgi:hypothetical protein
MNKDCNRAPVERRVIRPGKGWQHMAGAVFERTDGLRVHTLGLVRLPDGRTLSGSVWPESCELDRLIRINGNRKRGLMAWANVVAARGV